MGRNRIWVNFSKEFEAEYCESLKVENFSNLVCKLLREYYGGNISLDNSQSKIDEIYLMLKLLIEYEIYINNINTEYDDIEIL